MGHIDGRMRHFGWRVQQLRAASGRQSGGSRGCLRSGVPAAPGAADLRDHAAAGKDPARAAELDEDTERRLGIFVVLFLGMRSRNSGLRAFVCAVSQKPHSLIAFLPASMWLPVGLFRAYGIQDRSVPVQKASRRVRKPGAAFSTTKFKVM